MKTKYNYEFLAKPILDFYMVQKLQTYQQVSISSNLLDLEGFKKKVRNLEAEGELSSEDVDLIKMVSVLAKHRGNRIGSLLDEYNRILLHLNPARTLYIPFGLAEAHEKALNWTLILLARFNLNALEITGESNDPLLKHIDMDGDIDEQMQHNMVALEGLITDWERIEKGEYPEDTAIIRLNQIYRDIKPFRQCNWCGSTVDENGQELIETAEFCPHPGCFNTSSNNPYKKRNKTEDPDDHMPGCCAVGWHRFRGNFIDKQVRGYWERQEFSQEEYEKKFTPVFWKFMGKLHTHTLARAFNKIPGQKPLQWPRPLHEHKARENRKKVIKYLKEQIGEA